ncbi:hypothetical protein CEXT_434591 [Caerostris extrusa]|uniref:Uncharacterized protein n=1 Tax=Caerostris extrusa TaxID=172846 RepID=A0AAV4R797_CAEEX|nr:hypothetical protein CEXT_434591 [Caerostris extrusa]
MLYSAVRKQKVVRLQLFSGSARNQKTEKTKEIPRSRNICTLRMHEVGYKVYFCDVNHLKEAPCLSKYLSQLFTKVLSLAMSKTNVKSLKLQYNDSLKVYNIHEFITQILLQMPKEMTIVGGCGHVHEMGVSSDSSQL